VTRCDGETGQAGNRDNPPNVGGVTGLFNALVLEWVSPKCNTLMQTAVG
jgi:hypothetical protein